jgi:hypothetical protein
MHGEAMNEERLQKGGDGACVIKRSQNIII